MAARMLFASAGSNVSNGSRPSVWVRVKVGTESLTTGRSRLSICLNSRFGHSLMEISQPV